MADEKPSLGTGSAVAPGGAHAEAMPAAPTSLPAGVPPPPDASAPEAVAADSPAGLVSMLERLTAAGSDAERQRQAVAYGDMREIENLLFGEPKGSARDALVRQSWDRLRQTEGYTDVQKRVMNSMRNAAKKIFNAMSERLRQQGKTEAEGRTARQALNKYLRTVGVIGQAHKVKTTPYVTSGMSGSQLESMHDVMESAELVELENFATYLDQLNTQELVDTILEGQEFVDMLIQEINADGRTAVADIIPKQEPGSAYAEQTAADAAKVSVGKLDLNNPDKSKRAENYSKLIGFIMGDKTPGGKEKSESRRMTEAVLWAQIVKAMSFDQKEFLVRQMAYERGGDAARDVLDAFVRAGCITTAEIELIRQGEDHEEAVTGTSLPKTVTDEFLKTKIPAAIKDRKEYDEHLRDSVKHIENRYIRSAAMYFGTMNKFLWSRLIDFGFLTSSVNMALHITERYNKRQSNNESRVSALMGGIKEGFQNKWFWFGMGEMALGTNGMYPWIRGALISPSSSEREHVARYAEVLFFNGEAKNKPAMAQYIYKKLPDLMAIAKKNQQNTNPNQKKGEERGTDELYVGDVKFTPEQAGQLGYSTTVEAQAALMRMFNIIKRILKTKDNKPIETQQQLANYLNENELGVK